MKTKYFSMMLATLVMTSCSQNEITEMSPDANPAVGFSVYTGTQTKGSVTDNNTTGAGIKAKGFGILAAYTGTSDWSNTAPNFMYNQKVTWDTGNSGSWKYTPLKYWPKTTGDKISFWAYAPYDDSSNDQGIELSANTATTAPAITFTLKATETVANAKSMVDLVAGSVMNKVKPDDGTVSFTLKHVLSRVIFHAKASEELFSSSDNAKKTHIFITKAELKGSEIYTKATYTFSTDNTTANDAWNYTGAETASSTAKEITGILNVGNYSGSDIGSSTTKYDTSKAVDLNSTSAGSIFATDQYLFLIPPAATGIQTAANAQVKFTYDIVTIDSNLSLGYSKTTSEATVNLTANTLVKGTAYKYTFEFGVDAIKVSAAVDPNGWGTESSSSDIAVPTATN